MLALAGLRKLILPLCRFIYPWDAELLGNDTLGVNNSRCPASTSLSLLWGWEGGMKFSFRRKICPVAPTPELREVAFNAANRSGRWEYRLLLGISVLSGPKRHLTNPTKTILLLKLFI